jgi:plasmid maintenance system killer protein
MVILVELTVGNITGIVLDAVDNVDGVQSIVVNGTKLTIQVDAADGRLVKLAAKDAGAEIQQFTQRPAERFNSLEPDSDKRVSDIGQAPGET